jgi:fumarylacetoacetate (FAA) hydrolase
MKLATLRNNRPDGQLVVLSADLGRFVSAGRIAPTLQAALDDWTTHAPALAALAAQLDAGAIAGQPFDPALALAPLPRAYQWIDGAGYLSHLERVRSLKGSKDEELQSVRPLLYQGGSDSLSAPTDPFRVTDPVLAIDYEA